MRKGSRSGRRPGWAAVALLGVVSVSGAFAMAAPPAPSCAVTGIGSPACTAGDAASAPGSAVDPNGSGHHVGNPIEIASGNKYQRETDYRAFGTGLAFVRHYNSLLADEDVGLGPGWRHTYQVSLAAIRSGGLRLRQSDGRTLDFAHVPGTSDPDVHVGSTPADGLIVHENGHSSWYLPDGRRMDFRGPWLVRLDWGDARGALDVRYRNGRVARVTDRIGRTLVLRHVERADALPAYGDTGSRYRPPGALDSLVLPDGTQTRFAYDAGRTLEAVVRPDGARLEYDYTDPTRGSPHLSARRAVPAGTSGEDAIETRWRYDDGLAVGMSGTVGLDIERVPDGPHTGTSIVRWHDGRVETVPWSTDAPTPRTGSEPAPSALRRRSAERTGIDALADAALASLRTDPDGDGSTLLATVPLHGRSVPLLVRADPHGNLDLLRLGRTDLEALVVHRALGALPPCGADPTSDPDVVERLAALSGGGAPCAGDALVVYAFEAVLERRQRAGPPRVAADGSTAFEPAFETRRGFRPGARRPPPPYPRVVQGPEPSACDMPPGKDCADLAEDHEMALLSDCAYDAGPCASDWRRVDPAEIGLADIDFHDGGFDAVLYHDAATDRYTVAFRGTDGVGDDWRGANLAQGRGERTRQYDLAYKLAGDVLAALPGADVSFTGHSLGGGLATFAAISVKRQATVFNAAALHPATAARESLGQEYADADRYVDLLTIHGDPVTAMARTAHNWNSYGARFTPGRHTVLANPSDSWVDRNYTGGGLIDTPLARHSMAAVIEQLEILLTKHCGGVP